MAKDIQRTPEQLKRLRRVIGGGMAGLGLTILIACVVLNLTNLPLVITGLVLLVLGLVFAASMTVFEIIIQLLGGTTR